MDMVISTEADHAGTRNQRTNNKDVGWGAEPAIPTPSMLGPALFHLKAIAVGDALGLVPKVCSENPS